MKKKAEDLKPGDVVAAGASYKRAVVLKRIDSDGIDVRYVLGVLDEDRSIRRWFPLAEEVEVESPTLSPAQQHAEELHIYAKELHSILYGEQVGRGRHHRENLEELLARTIPPKPPTLEEALELVSCLLLDRGVTDKIRDMPEYKSPVTRAKALLDRARAAGYLGKE